MSKKNTPKDIFGVGRSVFKNEIFTDKPDKWFKIWIYIIGHVNWKDHADKDGFRRGERFFTYREICYATGATKQQLYRTLAHLKEETMVETRKTTRGFHVKLVNYEKYQLLPNYKKSKGDTQGDRIDDNLETDRRQLGDTIREIKGNTEEYRKETPKAPFKKGGAEPPGKKGKRGGRILYLK